MHLNLKTTLFDLLMFGLLALIFFAVPGVAATKIDPLTREQEALTRLQYSLNLGTEQSREIAEILERKVPEGRHLRRQMRATYTPEQRARARQIWLNEYQGVVLNEEQRQALVKQVGVTAGQLRQFAAYEDMIADHQQQTAKEISSLLDPSQQERFEALERLHY